MTRNVARDQQMVVKEEEMQGVSMALPNAMKDENVAAEQMQE